MRSFLAIIFILYGCDNINYNENPVNKKTDSTNDYAKAYINQSEGIYKNYITFRMTNCDSAVQFANRDFLNGKYYLIETGLVETDEFNIYFQKYINEKYKIEILQAGCLAQKGTICYTNKMKELLLEKGLDIYGKIRNDALKKYRGDDTKDFKDKNNLLDYFNRPRDKRLLSFKKEDYEKESDKNLTESELKILHDSFCHSRIFKKNYPDSVSVFFYVFEVCNLTGNIKVNDDNIELEYFPIVNPGGEVPNEAGLYKFTYNIKKKSSKERLKFSIFSFREKLKGL